MIEMVTFHGEVDKDHEFFATLSGADIHRRYFMKEDARGLHFFSHGNEILLTPEGVSYHCTGGQVSEYMFGASLPLEDILMEDVLNRLILFGAYEDAPKGEIYFTKKVSGFMDYDTVFLNGNAVCNYFFFVADPRNTSPVERQERTLRSLGKMLKRTDLVGREADTRLMEAIRDALQESASDVALICLRRRGLGDIRAALREHYRVNRRLPDVFEGEERLDPYQRERLRIDIIYQDPSNRGIIREYKTILARHRAADLPPSIRARLQRLRTLSIKHNVPSLVFDTLEQIIFQGKKHVEQEGEPDYIASSRVILEGFLLESGPFTHEVSPEELVTLLRNKQRASAERDTTFEEILLETGRLIDEKVSRTDDYQLLESFGALVTYLDRFDATASFINKLSFMDEVEMEETNARSLLNNSVIFNGLKPGLFDELFIERPAANPYLPAYGRRKLSVLSKGLKNIADNTATIQDLCFLISEVNREEGSFHLMHALARERLKHFYVDLNTLEGKQAFQKEIVREMKKRGDLDRFDEDLFQEVLRKIQLESFYLSQILPVILETQNATLREDFLSNSGLDRFIVEELEQEYFTMEKLDTGLLATLQAGPAGA
jgi:uncharacterized protein (TIGR04442 family)